jgi:hypothetical protein
MRPVTVKPTLNMHQVFAICRFSIGILALTGLAAAQDQTPHPWRSVNDPPSAGAIDQGTPDQGAADPNLGNQSIAADPQNNPQNNQGPPPPLPPNVQQQGPYQAPPPNYPAQGQYPPPPSYAPPPANLTIKAGTYVTVRINQWLSSERNQAGDAFTATLAEPVIVDGVIVAQRGQIVAGRVTEAKKAPRGGGKSSLGVQVTALTLVDGQQEPIQAPMITRIGPGSGARSAATIAGTTALGAAIGAGVGWGTGAGIGAAAGAAAGIIGVMFTPGKPTVIYPETVLTFQVEAPVTFSTEHAPQAFRYVGTQDYGGQPSMGQRQPAISCYDCGGQAPPPPPPAYGYGYAPPAPYPYPYAYGYGYGYGYGYPYPYYGGFSLFVGPRYGSFYGGGFRGGYRVYRR